MRYSLTDYILSVKIPDELLDVFATDTNDLEESSNHITIGGDGSYVGTIKVSMNKEQWTTEGDATGGYVHSKSKDKTGKVTVELNMLTDVVLKLTRLIETYDSSDTITNGLTLTVSKATSSGNSVEICNCVDCYLVKHPDGDWEDSAKNMSFDFTCGRITYSGNAM